jgi:hypothetical protein
MRPPRRSPVLRSKPEEERNLRTDGANPSFSWSSATGSHIVESPKQNPEAQVFG